MRTIIILLISIASYSQASIYLPVNTLHFENGKSYSYAENQGGDKGIVVSYEFKHLSCSVGVVRNSYGNPSKVFTIGYKQSFKDVDVVLSSGVADGYYTIYKRGNRYGFPEVLAINNMIPVVLLTTRIKVYKNTGLQVNISPVYVNYGIYIKI